MSTQSRRTLNPWELGAAAIFFALGAFMAFEGYGYGIGTITRIGPGFFPVSIGILLMLLSVAVGFEARYSLAKKPDIPRRISAVIVVGLVAFAALVTTAGLIPATFALVFISRFAEPGTNIRNSLILAAGVAFFAWLVFILGFNLPLKPFWW